MVKNQKVSKYSNKLISRLLLGIAILCISVAAVFAIDHFRAINIEPTPIVPQIIITEDTVTPEESPPKDEVVYAPEDPALITLPTINVEGYIQKVGLTKDSFIAVPSNIHVAGWFVDSVKPGDEGLSIIDGHASGEYRDGIFKKLDRLQIGDEFSVKYGDGTLRIFKVLEVKTMSEKESDKELFYKIPNVKAQLNLITCSGEYSRETQRFTKRIIVFAENVR
jgi:LPXTG-site transpeptidase (sortase) family protein